MNTSSEPPVGKTSNGGEAAPSDETHDRRLSPEQLAAQWAEHCIELLRPMDWPGRMDALMQLHDQLRNDFANFEVFCQVFPIVIAQTIERLGQPPVEDLNQAHIYANSSETSHREAAGDWLKANGQPPA